MGLPGKNIIASAAHFIGIGGAGMSGLAHLAVEKGWRVSGSDVKEGYEVSALRRKGATVFVGHRAEQVPESAVVIYSTAVSAENPEMQVAQQRCQKILHRSEFLAELMTGYQSLLVAGTHGKTTTSSLLTVVLETAGLSPSYSIGGQVRNTGNNGAWGRGPYFVAEADESDGSFLHYHPYATIITNIDADHLDYWKTFERLREGFVQFAEKVPASHRIWCLDDLVLSDLHLPGHTYGFSHQSDLCITQVIPQSWGSRIDIECQGCRIQGIDLSLIGKHNALNAASVWLMGTLLGISEEKLRKGLSLFQGAKRRQEIRGTCRGALLVDDYGHHPVEIRATIQALSAAKKEKKLIVAFQPHRYTRTQALWKEFLEAFEGCDALYLTDIYSAGECPIAGVDTPTLWAALQEKVSFPVYYCPRQQLSAQIQASLSSKDVLLTLGAGDITYLSDELAKDPVYG